MMFFWRDNGILNLKDSEGLQLGRSYPEEMQACPAKILNLTLSLPLSLSLCEKISRVKTGKHTKNKIKNKETEKYYWQWHLAPLDSLNK